ncbi:MAG: acetylornithine deacetylase [Gammaproteobacteria bacterium]|nr:MAG: acetylornithine deacetylase [Gammaproteobacteria bacterium]PIE36586.1 MAG: acetylornithine deacetylase [Gammaproteobacteria bacterium]
MSNRERRNDGQRSAEILEHLVGFDTVSAHSNLPMVDYCERLLAGSGFHVQRIPDAAGEKAGLVARIGPEGAGVVLSAHTDVVPVAGQHWTRDPFTLTRDADRLYGRGTTDMKGFVAAVLSLAEQAGTRPLKEPLTIVLSYDEEIGCIGIADMIDRVAPLIGTPRACIIGEPTSMQVATGHKGKVALKAVFEGENGHSAMAPNFLNALHPAGDFMTEIRELQAWYAAHGARDDAYGIPCTTLHVGRLTGGTALNIVPDRAEMLFEFRNPAVDDPVTIRQRIDEALDRVMARYPGGRVTVSEYFAYPGLDTPLDHDVVGWACDLAGQDTTKVAFGTEAGFFAALGVPTVVCGPGSMDEQGHKPDEYLSIDQLAACDAMLGRVLDDVSASTPVCA